MADDEIDIAIELRNLRATLAGLTSTRQGVKGVGDAGEKASRKADVARTKFLGLGNAMDRAGRRGIFLGAVLAGTVAYGLKRSVGAYAESNAVLVDQAAALKSTGALQWTNAKALQRQATILALKTGMDDEAIARTQTLGLTFTSVTNKGSKMYNTMIRDTLNVMALA